MEKKRLLIIEDEASVAKQLKIVLSEEYDISLAADPVEAGNLLSTGRFPVVTLDLGLPPYPETPQVGLALLESVPSFSPDTKVIVISGHDSDGTLMAAFGLGAVDVCPKPIDLKLLNIILSRTFRIHELEKCNRILQARTLSGQFCDMLGISQAMNRVFDMIGRVALTDYPVLIYGQSGTGKEMAARAVHVQSSRRDKPLVIINCGAIPENLLESELFGYEKGAFTGAAGRQIGKFEQADNGTIFLDEVGELPLNLQVKLLRFIQEGTIERLGASKPIAIDARIVAATNIDLEAAVEQGAFRPDLFFRLNVVPLDMPPLQEREEDVLLLAQHFIREEAQKLKRGKVILSPAAVTALTGHTWPGNVRELQNRIRRAMSLISGKILCPADFGLAEEEKSDSERLPTLREARDLAEKKVVRQALVQTNNNISQAARLLEVSRPTLHDLIRKHGIGRESGSAGVGKFYTAAG
ncbi:MAG: PEP-CTERM-box response regulator transcription factor [Proteobacteria bacterium]|nr:PEP-CTERM-box response regulator transcription factor [Pseudomonadota bacterium]MBU4296173.1 PEP-CTERM-box response regulator transcription factor [Pseudomonadota bacterium]